MVKKYRLSLQPSRSFCRLRAARIRARAPLSNATRRHFDRELSIIIDDYLDHYDCRYELGRRHPHLITAWLDRGAVTSSRFVDFDGMVHMFDIILRSGEITTTLELFRVLNDIVASPSQSWYNHLWMNEALPSLILNIAISGYPWRAPGSPIVTPLKRSELSLRFAAWRTLKRMLWVSDQGGITGIGRKQVLLNIYSHLQNLSLGPKHQLTSRHHLPLCNEMVVCLAHHSALSPEFEELCFKDPTLTRDYSSRWWHNFPTWGIRALLESDQHLRFSRILQSCEPWMVLAFFNINSATKATRADVLSLLRHKEWRDFLVQDMVILELCRRKERTMLEKLCSLDRERMAKKALSCLNYLQSQHVQGRKERLVDFFHSVLLEFRNVDHDHTTRAK